MGRTWPFPEYPRQTDSGGEAKEEGRMKNEESCLTTDGADGHR